MKVNHSINKYFVAIIALLLAHCAYSAEKITQYGITWHFDKDYPTGQYVNGDYWVKGPVKVSGISNSLHTDGFKAPKGRDGSMINPTTTAKQGYDNALGSYDSSLDVSYPDGKAISAKNPLLLNVNSSLVSAVSWLYNSESDKEKGCPRFNGGTKAPRPVLKAAAILTCVEKIPAKGSFRPAYCGNNKASKFNVNQLKRELLKNLEPVAKTPKLSVIEKNFERPWIDHVHQYLGANIHPSANMPEYGRDLSIAIGKAALMLNLDFSKLPEKPSKDKLLIRFIQLGIDFAGIADNGGSWPSNGGHHMGRKWPILFAGLMLDDEHMKNVGQWKTAFQEDKDTFYVSQKEIDMTHSSKWKPDKRAPAVPYTKADIGTPEWGIRHTKDPQCDNQSWKATYRVINNMSYTGWVLAAHIMGQKKAWNHNALFDYMDRAVKLGSPKHPPEHQHYGYYVFGDDFRKNMSKAYRDGEEKQ